MQRRIDNGDESLAPPIRNNSPVLAAGTTAHNKENVPNPGTTGTTFRVQVHTKEIVLRESIVTYEVDDSGQVFREVPVQANTNTMDDSVSDGSGAHVTSTMKPSPGNLELGQELEQVAGVSKPSSSTKNFSKKERRAAAIERAQKAMEPDKRKVEQYLKNKKAVTTNATTTTTATVTKKLSKQERRAAAIERARKAMEPDKLKVEQYLEKAAAAKE